MPLEKPSYQPQRPLIRTDLFQEGDCIGNEYRRGVVIEVNARNREGQRGCYVKWISLDLEKGESETPIRLFEPYDNKPPLFWLESRPSELIDLPTAALAEGSGPHQLTGVGKRTRGRVTAGLATKEA